MRHLDERLQRYKQAVRQAIEDGWKAGLPAFQIRGGYLVARYPGDREVKLKKVSDTLQQHSNGETEALDPGRTERGR
jgi:hypothetical protein